MAGLRLVRSKAKETINLTNEGGKRKKKKRRKEKVQETMYMWQFWY